MPFAVPYLDLTLACQRHTFKRTTYQTARPPFDPSRFGVEPIETAVARSFVETHHYSGTFPVEIASHGLFESKPNARATPPLCSSYHLLTVHVRRPSDYYSSQKRVA